MAAAGLDLGNLLVHLSADASQFKRVMNSATTRMRRFADTFRNIGREMVKYSKVAAVAATGYAAISVKAFASFEEQMANVSTMLDEQTMHYMPQYEKALKSMAIEFGEGTETLSRGLYDILSASIAPNKALMVLTASVKAARAGMTDTATAADAITTILNSYGLAAEEAGRVSDVLFAIVKRGKLTFGGLAPNIGKVASIASTANLSFEELGAAIATMTRAGLQVDLATTSLRAMLNTFIKPTPTAIQLAKDFGFELSSATLQAIGLTGVLEKLKGATAEELAALMPNVRGLAGFAAALKNAEKQTDDLRLMLNSTGLTQVAFEKMTNTLMHTFRRWWQSIKIMSVSVGSYFAPAIRRLVDIATEANKRILEFLEGNKDYVQYWALVIAAHINFVRKVMQDFIMGLPSNWEETWKYMKDIAIATFDVIWGSLKIGGKSALNILIASFIALGKSLEVIFDKIWSEFENRAMVATQRAIAKQIEYNREFKKALRDIKEETGYKGIFTTAEARIEAGRRAAEAVALATRQGIFKTAFPSAETISWGEALNKMEPFFTTVFDLMKDEAVKVGNEIIELQRKAFDGITRPEWIQEIIDTRLEELRKREQEIIDAIHLAHQEEWIAQLRAAGKAVGGEVDKDGRRRGEGVDGTEGGGRLGFVGFEQAWGAFAKSMEQDKTQENILSELEKQTGLLDGINKVDT